MGEARVVLTKKLAGAYNPAVERAVNQSLRAGAVSSERSCPCKNAKTQKNTHYDTTCDVCKKKNIPRGVLVHSCRDCAWDMCMVCRGFAKPPGNAPAFRIRPLDRLCEGISTAV